MEPDVPLKPAPVASTGRRLPRRLSAAGRVARLLVPFTVALAVWTGSAPGAGADIGWCRTDPGVAIDGRVVNIFVSAPLEILGAATGPTEVVVYVPVGTAVEVLWTDPGFGFGETVRFVETGRLGGGARGTKIIVGVTVPAVSLLPVLVEVVGADGGVDGSALGLTNGTVAVWARV
jgi:hypothetical protein